MAPPKGHEPYPGCETGGRPKKYTQEFIEKEALALEEWMVKPTSPWFEDFANIRGYSPDYLSEWAKENDKFFGVYKRFQSWQKSILVRGGLTNKFNPSFTKFVMSNTCGWSDKQESKISGDAVNPLSFILQNVDGKSKEFTNETEG
jgi:hypothetical protein